jgi:dihydrodipicolinate synthase/N-acetylneuraminate lyase
LSLAALVNANSRKMIEHVQKVAEVLPVVGFYLQPAVGGRVLPYAFWRQFVEIKNVVGIKIAPFNRYQTIDVMRAVAESGRELALYTGNDDNIVIDLLSEYHGVKFVGGLLGHWSVWTKKAVEMQAKVRKHKDPLRLNMEVTDANAAFFDAANGFKGCIAGLHEVLRRQGLLEGIWCLDPHEGLSKGQAEEIDRVYAAYPHLHDDEFVAAHRDKWLRG